MRTLYISHPVDTCDVLHAMVTKVFSKSVFAPMNYYIQESNVLSQLTTTLDDSGAGVTQTRSLISHSRVVATQLLK